MRYVSMLSRDTVHHLNTDNFTNLFKRSSV